MTENDTVFWIKEQLNKGYSLAQIREKLINSNYLPENADKLLNMAVNEIPETKNISSFQSDKTDKQPEIENYKEESCIKIGVYAGICSLIIFILFFVTMVFFDSYTYFIHLFLIVLLEAFIIVNRSGTSIKKIMCSVLASYVLFVAGVLVVLYLFIVHYIFYPIDKLEMPPEFFILIVGIILGFVILEIVVVILNYLMKKRSLRKINILKPILIIAGIYLFGMGLFCLTGPKIIHEPIEVYWCGQDNNDIVRHENVYETSVTLVTGYDFESYFTQTPNINNRFAMNKYELATMLLAMINSASVDLQNTYIIHKFEEINQTDKYYNDVVKKTDFNLNKLQNISKDKAIILILDGYNSCLINLKDLIENTNLNYTGEPNYFRDKEQHLKYIQTKIDINKGLKERCKDMNLANEDNSKINYYTKAKIDALKTLVSAYKIFVRSVSTNVKIIDVSFERTSEENKNKILVKLKNEGLEDMDCNAEDIYIYVGDFPVEDLKCEFKILEIGEEGVCSGIVRYPEDLPNIIKLKLPRYESIYIYQSEKL